MWVWWCVRNSRTMYRIIKVYQLIRRVACLMCRPTLDFRYKFSKTSKLRINYRGKTTQPTISQLLAIRDESDPLNISTGNPGLKPAFTQSLRLFYDSYSEKKKRAMMTFLDFSTTNNAISNSVTYNEATGGLLSRPENINGNWNFNSAFMTSILMRDLCLISNFRE